MAAAAVKKVAPVLKARRVIDSGEQDLGNAGVAMPGPGASIVHEVEVVDPARVSKAKLDNLAFNEEIVVVRVQETDDQFAPQFVDIWVNGKKQRFMRGQDTKCARKFVEGLCRAKPVSYRNEAYQDNEGATAYRWPTRSGLAFPFQMISDKNPRGEEWLRKLLRERS